MGSKHSRPKTDQQKMINAAKLAQTQARELIRRQDERTQLLKKQRLLKQQRQQKLDKQRQQQQRQRAFFTEAERKRIAGAAPFDARQIEAQRIQQEQLEARRRLLTGGLAKRKRARV